MGWEDSVPHVACSRAWQVVRVGLSVGWMIWISASHLYPDRGSVSKVTGKVSKVTEKPDVKGIN